MAEVKSHKVKQLSSRLDPNAIYWVQASANLPIEGFITDINGVPYPLKDLQGSGGITTLTNTDGNLVITGADNKIINLAPALLSVINSALQSGANISELLNDAGFITIADIPTNVSEFTNDGADGTSTYVETDELGLTAFSNDYNDLDNKPTIPTGITNHSGLSLDDGTNPHGTTKQDVGLGDVPNLNTTEAVNKAHEHTNFSILNGTEESFTTALKNAYNSAVSWITTNGTNLINHLSNISNPHNVTKSQVGLGSVDNTSDIDKPISTATQNALDSKLDKSTTPSSVYTTDAGGLQVMKPLSELGGTSDTYSCWFSYIASHVTSAVIYTNVVSGNLTTTGTQSLIGTIGTSLYNSFHFLNWVGATTAGANAGIKNNNSADAYYRQGVKAYFIFGNNDTNTAHSTVVGMYGLATAIPNLAISSFTTDFVGVGNDASDTNLSLYCKRNDATASYIKIDCGSNFPAHTAGTDVFMLEFESNKTSVQADLVIMLTLTNLITGDIFTHTFTGLECPDLNKGMFTTINRNNRGSGATPIIRWVKTFVERKLF